jgi:hypothetical protein
LAILVLDYDFLNLFGGETALPFPLERNHQLGWGEPLTH